MLKATGQRCRVHFMRNVLAYAHKTQRRMVSAAIGTVFVQETPEAARTQWRSVANQFREKLPKLAACLDETEHDVLAFMTFPRAHWAQIYSTNPLERLNAEIKRRKACRPSAILRQLGCRQCRAKYVNLNLSGLTTYTTPRDITFVGPKLPVGPAHRHPQ